MLRYDEQSKQSCDVSSESCLNLMPKVNSDGETFCVTNNGKEFNINVVQIVSMLLSKLKFDAEKTLSEIVTGCVIAVPSHFSESSRHCLLIAAGVANLNVHYITNETTAIALNYGFYKKFPNPTNVVFVDFGYSTFQIAICQFTDNKIEILAEESKLIGGRDIDELLAKHFMLMIDKPQENKVFCVGLLEEVEIMKKKMSVDTIDILLNTQHLLDDDNISIGMPQHEMEQICKSLFEKIEKLMRKCLSDVNISLEDIHSIEIVGGSTRIPAVKRLIETVFGKPPIATMNQDEAVSQGSLLRFIVPRKKRGFQIIEKENREKQAIENDNLNIEDENSLKIIDVSKKGITGSRLNFNSFSFTLTIRAKEISCLLLRKDCSKSLRILR